jgi:VIT1/CCC1 family predicted Fe2+/Mn2+ transporter
MSDSNESPLAVVGEDTSTEHGPVSDLDKKHGTEPHDSSVHSRLNWLRAGVLGANDGIVSVAAIVVGVAGATSNVGAIATAGIAAVVGGAISMALGEYVSVSSQSDSQLALIEKERRELAETPDEELAELAEIYQSKGLTPETAKQVALELTAHDALGAHLEAELHITEQDVASAWQAAFASAVAFLVGAALPLITILVFDESVRVPLTFGAVLIALATTGIVGARIGDNPWLKPTVRIVSGGAIALAVTFGIGLLLGVSGVV